MDKTIKLPIRTIVDGREWRLFSCTFATPDGKFCGYLYAISAEHAVALLAELKETATLDGELCGTIDV